MKHLTSHASFHVRRTALAAIFASAIAGGALADIERDCSLGLPLREVWAAPDSIPWTFCSGPGANFLVPGFPASNCGIASGMKRPGFQSLDRAEKTWNSVTSPVGLRAANFQLKLDESAALPAIPAGGGFQSRMWPVAGLDGLNTVSFWENPGFFGGGPLVLAAAPLSIDPTTGFILECDIAFQARTVNATGSPFWSFVERNDSLGIDVASDPNLMSSSTFRTPVFGYADIEGTLVHELGHLLGLAHSLVDSISTSTSSSFPTMFFAAQTEPYQVTLSVFPSTTCTASTTPSNPLSTFFDGRLGASARTLELDDVWSISQGYPMPPGNPIHTQTGGIAGAVLDAAFAPVLAASVVAFDASQPDVRRVGTMSYSGGAFSIPGLPPGQYFLYVEPIDAFAAGAYFGSDPFALPSFLSAPCITGLPPAFFAEFYDGAESGTETRPMNATPITVSAGVTSTATVIVTAGTSDLTVRPVTSPPSPFSPRGAILVGDAINNLPAPTSFELRVTGAQPNAPVLFSIDLQRTSLPLFGQLLQVAPTVLVQVTSNASGVATFTQPLTPVFEGTNLFAQAAYQEAPGDTDFKFTNAVNIWFVGP